MKHATALAIIVLLFSCSNPFKDQNPNPAGTVTVSLSSGRSVVTNFLGQIASVRISMSSDEGYTSPAPVTLNAAPWTASFTGVHAGSWDIDVIAFNAAGDQIGAGSALDQLLNEGSSLNVPVTVSFSTADTLGDMALSLSFPTSTGIDYVSGTLIETGVEQIPELIENDGTSNAAFVYNNLAAGTYSLQICFRRGGSTGTSAGIFMEKVEVVGGFTADSWVSSDGSLAELRSFAESEFFATNNALANLVVSDGILSEGQFSSATDTYNRGAITGIDGEVTVLAELSMDGQSLEYSWDRGSTWHDEIRPDIAGAAYTPINVPGIHTGSDNELQVRVTAPDRETSRIYTVSFSKGYTVNYDGNGNDSGEPPVDVTIYEAGEQAIAMPQGSLERSGYIFSDWTIGSGPETVAAGSAFTMPAENTTLHANWSLLSTIIVDVSFDKPEYGYITFSNTGVVSRGSTLSFVPTVAGAGNWQWYVDGALQDEYTESFNWDTTGLDIKQYIISAAALYNGHVCTGSMKVSVCYP